jgi:hypothetical protein
MARGVLNLTAAAPMKSTMTAFAKPKAWREPILRAVDTAVGASFGVAVAWLGGNAMGVLGQPEFSPMQTD